MPSAFFNKIRQDTDRLKNKYSVLGIILKIYKVSSTVFQRAGGSQIRKRLLDQDQFQDGNVIPTVKTSEGFKMMSQRMFQRASCKDL